MGENTLSINTSKPLSITEFINDFFNSFPSPLTTFVDFNTEIPTIRRTLIDRTGFPRANIKNISGSSTKGLLFTLALPGWNTENSELDINITDSLLTITGTKKNVDTKNDVIDYTYCNDCIVEPGEQYGKMYEQNISLKDKFVWKYTVTDNAILRQATLKDGLLNISVEIPSPKPKDGQTIKLGKD